MVDHVKRDTKELIWQIILVYEVSTITRRNKIWQIILVYKVFQLLLEGTKFGKLFSYVKYIW